MENGVLLQGFHWELPADGRWWRAIAEHAAGIARAGFSAVWLPPATKGAAGPDDVGYAVYDLYDLGEYDQKGARRTKYGTVEELADAVRALRGVGLQVYADVVLNHRQGADEVERLRARAVDPQDRTRVAEEVEEIEAWTRFTCPGRGDAHSAFVWDARCFSSVDCRADAPDRPCLYLLDGKRFAPDVSGELGNFDHLLGCDVDFDVPEVREELCRWGAWFAQRTGVDGFRLDALKHIPASFYTDFLARLRADGREWLAIGEYWSADLGALTNYLAATGGAVKLFDVPLHFRLFEAGRDGTAFDLRTVFDGTLVQASGPAAVTFVDNHDTQPGQSLESFVADWFKPLAYALILLRRDGYPCVFWGDYAGHEDPARAMRPHRALLETLLDVRRRYNHGDQHDCFDDPTSIAWVRTGDADHPGSMVVVLSTGEATSKRLNACAPNARFRDALGHVDAIVETDAEGMAEFPAPAGSLAVWIQE